MTTNSVSIRILEHITFAQVLEHFELLEDLEEKAEFLVGTCPICNKDGLKVNLAKNTLSCAECKKRGSVIDFVSVFKEVGLKEAGVILKSLLEGRAPSRADRQRSRDASKGRRRQETRAKQPPAPEASEEIAATVRALDVKMQEVNALVGQLVKLCGST